MQSVSLAGEHTYPEVAIGHFTVAYIVTNPLIWSEAGGDHVVIETSI